ncbi:MAG TPA: ASCH domain-containing protein [Candidatus Saccharimonadales bacterium]|jgi:ASC-1-like (ASCH) protein|nr:ASCH domain-containing protein [Candidatus Saccharimonadales bacterium]
MEYTFDTNDRPFKAILAGTKKVEGRTPVEHDKTPYDKFKTGDLINLINNLTNEVLKARVSFIHHYPSARKMLEKEGPEKVLSSVPKTIEHGIEAYNSLNGYEEGIKKNGIYAIGLELL